MSKEKKEEAKEYTKDEICKAIYQAVRTELMESNKSLNIKKKLTSRDYETLGIIHQAMKRL